jgi:hypothetical protein
MNSRRMKPGLGGLSLLLLSVLPAVTLAAQGRVVLPEGSVIMVRTTTPLESASAQTGQTFETVVSDEVRVDNYTAIPAAPASAGW